MFGMYAVNISEDPTMTSSTSMTTNTANFITATVNEDTGSTSYKPFLIFDESLTSGHSTSTAPLQCESDTISMQSSYEECPPLASDVSPTPSPKVSLVAEKAMESGTPGVPKTSAMTAANAVTAVLLFVLASSVALAFATGWAPRMLGLRHKQPPSVVKDAGTENGEIRPTSSRDTNYSDPEKLGADSVTENFLLESGPALSFNGRTTYPDTNESEDDWLKRWRRRKEEILARLRGGGDIKTPAL